ncbi:flagellar basal body rod protein FlgB [Brevibacillus massiliensis]|jgi:flagellar basal-body rod protein FlgB|uniref:flagellar basal body rod protein FlgB n=1 Tax=Brevibacillus massiliensis TaxID=1118054 RepID=UPI0002DB6BA4|nr:flagellar basal body rod protein FlgB [Brevibacillus massiliensis]
MDQLQLLARALDVGMLRQRTIANNIANMDTPQFKSKQVVFEDLLHQELSGEGESGLAAYRTDPRHIAFGSGQAGAVPYPQIVSNPDALVQNNGNDVDVEYEMNQLAKNTIWYNGLVQMTNGYFTKLKTVIDGGGR